MYIRSSLYVSQSRTIHSLVCVSPKQNLKVRYGFTTSTTLKQRTNFSKLFNLTCRYFCEMNHIKYTEVFNQLLNSKNIICPRFTNNDDHHLNGIESDDSFNQTVTDIFRATLILAIDS